MIINDIKLKSYGLPIGSELQAARLTAAIREAEFGIVKKMIGDDNYRTLAAMQDVAPERAGGDITIAGSSEVKTIAGVDVAIAYIAFACLLRHDVVATTFGSVKKRDEYSTAAETWEAARYYYSYGELWVKELCEAKGWEFSRVNNYFRII